MANSSFPEQGNLCDQIDGPEAEFIAFHDNALDATLEWLLKVDYEGENAEFNAPEGEHASTPGELWKHICYGNYGRLSMCHNGNRRILSQYIIYNLGVEKPCNMRAVIESARGSLRTTAKRLEDHNVLLKQLVEMSLNRNKQVAKLKEKKLINKKALATVASIENQV